MKDLYKEIEALSPEKRKQLELKLKNKGIDVSRILEQSKENSFINIASVAEKEYYAVSSAQKRLYVLAQIENASIAYNNPAVFEIEGKLDVKRLKETFQKIIERHEILRTSFEMVEIVRYRRCKEK